MDLVEAARNGREAAFLQLFDEHHLPLFRFAYRLTGSVADAEDIVQECFLSLLRPECTYDSKRTPVLDRLLAAHPDIAASPGAGRVLPDFTASHRTAAVRVLLAAGLPVDARGDLGGTALHWACWKGYADLVEILLSHGATLTIEDQQFHGTPPGWFGHGVQNCNEPGGDYPQVARLLIVAGATIPKVDLPTGQPDVDAVLRERGLI
jgi:hypothetical protein